ncbi:hypothetical protein QR680_017959 [Steinernema hermaphroditum]|uniref:Cytochrome P450 n=1 Tax=Steinernema hermaphroditum TaxID=289476 RepID=A0AA39HGF1_9BILA|nr:hypothetical protein QR680_017959 [Steinernema hermaphroditum]
MLPLGAGEVLLPVVVASYFLFKNVAFLTATTVLVVGVSSALCYLKYKKTYWKRRGIPGPPTNLFLGNIPDMARPPQEVDVEWKQEYGRIFGTYMFGAADLTVCDISMVKQIMCTDFANFVDRPQFLPYNSKDKTCLFQNSLNSREGEEWKELRHQLTPAFTTGKIKNIIPLFNKCARIYLQVLDDHHKQNKPVDLNVVNHRLTMDTISQAAFGVDVHSQTSEKNPFMEHASSFFTDMPLTLTFIWLFPNILMKFQQYTGMQIVLPKSHNFFLDILNSLYEKRFKNKELSKSADFYEFILQALSKEHREAVDPSDSSPNTKSYEKIEINAQAFLFLLAGYETTAFTLTAAFYLLALNPEAQEKARSEARRVVPGDSDVFYEQVSQLQYIDQVISETLRMYTAGPRIWRMCTQSTQVGDYFIEKGTSITIPVNLLHYDEELYPDPHHFNPDRFSAEGKAERNPLAFLGFGAGPRNCIGARFAQIQMKILIAVVLRRFKLSVSEDAPRHPLKMNPGAFSRWGQKLFVKLEPQ